MYIYFDWCTDASQAALVCASTTTIVAIVIVVNQSVAKSILCDCLDLVQSTINLRSKVIVNTRFKRSQNS